MVLSYIFLRCTLLLPIIGGGIIFLRTIGTNAWFTIVFGTSSTSPIEWREFGVGIGQYCSYNFWISNGVCVDDTGFGDARCQHNHWIDQSSKYQYVVPDFPPHYKHWIFVHIFFLFLVRKWLYIHLVGQIFIVLWALHFYHLIMSVFIPISGRSGGYKNPDITIGAISCFFTLFVGSYLVIFHIFFFPCVINNNEINHFFIWNFDRFLWSGCYEIQKYFWSQLLHYS